MFERYTERARRALFFARYEASVLGSITIETRHLLLGLAREDAELTARIFAKHDVSFAAVRVKLARGPAGAVKVTTSAEIPFSTGCKRALQFAAEEADRMLHPHIGTEHLLLGLLRVDDEVTAALADLGLHADDVREEIVRLLNGNAGRSSEAHLHAIDGVAQIDAQQDPIQCVEQIRAMVEGLGEAVASREEASQLIARILRDLDALRQHL